MTGAGLEDVEVRDVPVPYRAESFDEWWGTTTALAGPRAKMIEALPPEATEQLRARAREGVAPYAGAGGRELPGVALLASGHA